VTVISGFSVYLLIDGWGLVYSNTDLLKFLSFAFIVIYSSRFILLMLVGVFIKQISNYRTLNFIMKNNLDRINLESFNNKKRGIVKKSLLAIAGIIITIAENIVSALIYERML
jgi:hypothetical protein